MIDLSCNVIITYFGKQGNRYSGGAWIFAAIYDKLIASETVICVSGGLYMEFINNPDSGAEFFNNVIPAKLREEAAKNTDQGL